MYVYIYIFIYGKMFIKYHHSSYNHTQNLKLFTCKSNDLLNKTGDFETRGSGELKKS